MKIKNIVLLAFVIMIVISSSITNYYLYLNSKNMLEEHVENKLIAVSEERANHIETYLEQNIERLKLINSRTKLRSLLQEYPSNPSEKTITDINAILVDAKEALDELERVCIFSNEGVVIASTNSAFLGKDVSQKSFYIEGKEKYSINFVMEDGELKLFVSGPIIKDNELLGVGVSVVKLTNLKYIVSSKVGLKTTGEVLLAFKNEKGEIVYLSDLLFEEDKIIGMNEEEDVREPMKKVLEGESKFFLKTLDYRGEVVSASTKYIPLGNLGLVAKIDYDEAIGMQKIQLMNLTISLTLITILFFIIVGFYISKLISHPIENLTKNVDQITKGNLEIHLTSSKLYEIHNLTLSLNRILASMKLAILRTGSTKEELGLEELTSEKNKLKSDLEDTEEELQKYLDVSMGLIVALNNDGTVRMINKSGLKLLGYSDAKEVLGKDWINVFIPKEKRKEVRALSEKMLSDKMKVNVYSENEVLTKQGKKIRISWHGETFTYGEDHKIGHISVGVPLECNKLVKAHNKFIKEKEKLKSQKTKIVKTTPKRRTK
jgi:PAS domain S-box-containing protein